MGPLFRFFGERSGLTDCMDNCKYLKYLKGINMSEKK